MKPVDLHHLTEIYGRCIVLSILKERQGHSYDDAHEIGMKLYCLLRRTGVTDADLRSEVDRQGRARVKVGRHSSRVLLTAEERRP